MHDRVRALLFPKLAQTDIGNVMECEWKWFGFVDGDEIELTGFRPVAVTPMPQGVYVWFKEAGTTKDACKVFWPMGKAERDELKAEIRRLGFPVVRSDWYLTDRTIPIR